MPTVLNVTNKVMATSVTKMTVAFRGNKKKTHKGVDLIPNSTSETPNVLAYDAGIVIHTQNINGTNENTGNPGMGTAVAIKHADGKVTRYQHLKYNSLKVKTGDKVSKGQPLALFGRPTNGFSSGPHLHFDLSLPVKPSGDSIKGAFCGETRFYVDPVPYLTKSGSQPVAYDSSAKQYKVSASSLRVRTGPGLLYGQIAFLKFGTVVNVYEEKNGFGKISKNKQEWVSLQYLEEI